MLTSTITGEMKNNKLCFAKIQIQIKYKNTNVKAFEFDIPPQTETWIEAGATTEADDEIEDDDG